MKSLLFLLLVFVNIKAYDFVLLNNTEMDDTDIIERIENQLKNYYDSDESEIVFHDLEDKEEVLKILDKYDYSGDMDEQEQLISKYEDLETDLSLIFKTKYLLVVSEKTNRDNRKELEIVLKVDNVNYYDGNFVMPNINDKELHYMDTITNVVLTYLTYKDKNFIKINQL